MVALFGGPPGHPHGHHTASTEPPATLRMADFQGAPCRTGALHTSQQGGSAGGGSWDRWHLVGVGAARVDLRAPLECFPRGDCTLECRGS